MKIPTLPNQSWTPLEAKNTVLSLIIIVEGQALLFWLQVQLTNHL